MIKRLWGIRHIRYFWLVYRLNSHLDQCARLGLGYFPQQSDLDYLEGVWEGKV
jgi:hypothetical protein